ncbi:MAG TPA: GNAT family N-acetyltransferase [Lachnospiraceae bacterium]|nr:GNAT family N-acetyltransferase [Lachnospiraceae bacterium]
MIRLETERLILRNYQLTDIEDVYEYFSKEEVAKYEDFDPMTMEEVTEEVTEWADMDNRLVAVLKETQKVIGSVGYWVDEDEDYSIDFDFNPTFGKEGYATEAAHKLLDYLFTEKKIPKIFGDCDIRNENSYKLMERLGFKRIEQIDNESYKDDAQGNPIKISIYLYLKDNSTI